jgi:hypothetical protein
MSPVPAKVHPGIISRKEKVVKSKIKLGLPFMMYIHSKKKKQNKKKCTSQKTKKMSNTDHTKKWGMLAKGKQFLPIMRHSPCY